MFRLTLAGGTSPAALLGIQPANCPNRTESYLTAAGKPKSLIAQAQQRIRGIFGGAMSV